MRGFLTTFMILFQFLASAEAQIAKEHRETFLEGESYFLFEEYADALNYYLQLNRIYPENDNINYKIGVCLLNDPYRKAESIAYLESATRNINPNFKEDSFKEVQAPAESHFFLGNAYRTNNQLEKAIETYKAFKKIGDPEIYNFELVDDQILCCENALEMMNRPVDFRMTNLGERINTRHSDMNPVISGDHNKLVYVQQIELYLNKQNLDFLKSLVLL